MKMNEKKEWARLLFIRENFTQKEIASRVGVSEQTLSKWVNKESWEHMRTSLVITKEEQLRRIYDQIAALNNDIASGEERRYATPAQADTINKLAAAARALETDVALADIIEVAKRIINWLRPLDMQKAKDTTELFDAFIKDTAKKS